MFKVRLIGTGHGAERGQFVALRERCSASAIAAGGVLFLLTARMADGTRLSASAIGQQQARSIT